MAKDQYRVGIVGYGLSAKVFHIPYILSNPRWQLGAIVQRSGDEARADHPPPVTIYRSAIDLFADPGIDAVVISTPPQTHYGLVTDALTAGKHVIVEKPFCPTSKECDELIALAKARGKLLTVYQNRRWDADFVTLRQLLADDKLGRVVEFETHFDRYDPDVPTRDVTAAPGAGVIFDLGTHLYDQVLQIYGFPQQVTAFLAHQRPAASNGGPQDACTAILHYKSGLLVTVKASSLSAEERQLRFWIRGEKGSFQKHHLDPQEPQLVASMKPTDPDFGLEPAERSGVLTTYEAGALLRVSVPNQKPPTYGEFYSLFALALDNGGGPLPVTPEEARNVIRLVEMSQESSDTNRPVHASTGDFLE